MTFPAWYAFYKDPVMRRHPAAARVYAAILSLERIMYEPRPIKAWVIADGEGLKRDTVRKALHLLVERGYLNEHGRATRNVRMLSVATVVTEHDTQAPERAHLQSA